MRSADRALNAYDGYQLQPMLFFRDSQAKTHWHDDRYDAVIFFTRFTAREVQLQTARI
jgi:hypothetical protein